MTTKLQAWHPVHFHLTYFEKLAPFTQPIVHRGTTQDTV